LDDHKGVNITILDVRELSNVTDYYLLVTGTSSPHLKALADETQRALRKSGVKCYRQSGTPDSGWLVLDYLDLVIHIFTEETRGYYALEQLWSDAPKVE